jgi:hypothetical protein
MSNSTPVDAMLVKDEKSLFGSDTYVRSSSSVLGFYIALADDGELFLDAEYQRPYVWGELEQQELLRTVFRGQPMGGVAVVINDDSVEKYCEIVDGKQRLTTLLKFRNNEIPYITEEGTEVYHADMSAVDRRAFKSTHMPQYQLLGKDGKSVSLAQKLAFFCRVNFGGIPQDDSHKEKVLSMLAAEQHD